MNKKESDIVNLPVEDATYTAQYEIRTMVKMMCDELIKVEPWSKPYLVPKCERLGFCDEAKGCGRKPKMEGM